MTQGLPTPEPDMHINYRRETRARAARHQRPSWGSYMKHFKAASVRAFRAANNNTLRTALAQGTDWDDVTFPILDEVEDPWSWD